LAENRWFKHLLLLKELEAARAELVSELQQIVLEVEAMKAEHQVAIDAVQKKHNDEMAAIRASLDPEGFNDPGELVCNFFQARCVYRNTLLYMRAICLLLKKIFLLSFKLCMQANGVAWNLCLV
jgi:hypothetical protein